MTDLAMTSATSAATPPATTEDWKHLRDVVVAFYRATPPALPASPFLRAAADLAVACDDINPSRAGGARKAIADRLVTAIATSSPTDATLQVLKAFLRIEPSADWLHNPNYTNENIGQSFLDGYGYIEFLGPGRVIACSDLRLGFLALAPGIVYPDHDHPAQEVYHPIAGAAEWWRSDGHKGWTDLPAGAVIHHRPHVRHATRTGARPLLALYCWGGDIAPHAALTQGTGKS